MMGLWGKQRNGGDKIKRIAVSGESGRRVGRGMRGTGAGNALCSPRQWAHKCIMIT